MKRRDRRVHNLPAVHFQAFECTSLVFPHKAAVAHYVGYEDGDQSSFQILLPPENPGTFLEDYCKHKFQTIPRRDDGVDAAGAGSKGVVLAETEEFAPWPACHHCQTFALRFCAHRLT
jgi:hypothetical protein